MLKMTIDNEEVLSNNDISIKEEILSPSSTILNNVYPKSWELDKDYTSRFYYPKDYSKLNIQNFSIEPEEAGKTIQVNGSATLTDVDTSKESRVLRLLGQTSQTGTPTPSSPIPINVVSGDNTIEICGKNLLDIDAFVKGRINNTTGLIEYASNVSSMVIGENNISFIVSVAWNSGITSDFIPVSIGSYVFRYGHNREITMAIDTYDSQKTKIARIDSFTQTQTPTTRTFTISDSNVKYIRIHFEVNAANVEYIVSEMQLEKGSTATTYEPYIGHPYPIYLGVEGNVVDTLYNTQIGSNGGITSNTARVANVNIGGTSNLYLQAGTYTLSIPNLDQCTCLTKNSSGTIIDNFANSWQTLPFTFTLTQAGYLYFTGRKSNNTTITPSDYKAQVNQGSQVNYVSDNPIELCKIGIYQDYIYKDNGSWYLHKEIGKVVLDGTINWTLNQPSTYVNQYLMSGTNLSEDVETGTANIMSDYFKYKQGNPTNSTNEDYMWLYQKKLVLDVRKTIVSDASGLKTWVGNNKPTIYYQLATPTNTEITDTTLLEQLDDLESQ